MEAFFADIKQWGVYQDYGYTPNPDLKGWDNDHPFPPEIEVDSPYLKGRIAKDRSEGDAQDHDDQTSLTCKMRLTYKLIHVDLNIIAS